MEVPAGFKQSDSIKRLVTYTDPYFGKVGVELGCKHFTACYVFMVAKCFKVRRLTL